MASQVVSRHDGEIPRTLDELTALAGVGRKTANVVLGTAFGIASGIVVDTHVKRLAKRLGLTSKNTPEQIERELMAIVPRTQWVDLSHRLIHHGRRVCVARGHVVKTARCHQFAPSSASPRRRESPRLQNPARRRELARRRRGASRDLDWRLPRGAPVSYRTRTRSPEDQIQTHVRPTNIMHIQDIFQAMSNHVQFRVLPTQDRQGL